MITALRTGSRSANSSSIRANNLKKNAKMITSFHSVFQRHKVYRKQHIYWLFAISPTLQIFPFHLSYCLQCWVLALHKLFPITSLLKDGSVITYCYAQSTTNDIQVSLHSLFFQHEE
jgi:hypothetical protein